MPRKKTLPRPSRWRVSTGEPLPRSTSSGCATSFNSGRARKRKTGGSVIQRSAEICAFSSSANMSPTGALGAGTTRNSGSSPGHIRQTGDAPARAPGRRYGRNSERNSPVYSRGRCARPAIRIRLPPRCATIRRSASHCSFDSALGAVSQRMITSLLGICDAGIVRRALS